MAQSSVASRWIIHAPVLAVPERLCHDRHAGWISGRSESPAPITAVPAHNVKPLATRLTLRVQGTSYRFLEHARFEVNPNMLYVGICSGRIGYPAKSNGISCL